MSEQTSTVLAEPELTDASSGSGLDREAAGRSVLVVPASPSSARPEPVPAPGYDQFARLEDKAARIEEKLSRFEAANQRVVDRFELAAARMSEVALQSDLSAVRSEVSAIARRVRNIPGLTALVTASIVTALLTATITIAIVRFLPGILAR